MNIKNLVLTFVIATAGAGCAEVTGADEADRVYFEIEYINYAWTPTYFGFIVDGAGRVFRYDRNGAPWPYQDSASWTRERLDAKFVPIKRPLDSRPPAEVAAAAAKIDAAAVGQLSPRRIQCADAGTLTYRAFDYDPETARYSSVLLRVEGDIAQQNTSEAAQELIAYIRSLNLLEELLGCDP